MECLGCAQGPGADITISCVYQVSPGAHCMGQAFGVGLPGLVIDPVLGHGQTIYRHKTWSLVMFNKLLTVV